MLEINNLHAFYGQIHALKGASLKVTPGEIVCLIGANGAGKTTLLMSICGLLGSVQGTIEFMDQNLRALSPDKVVRAGISLVPEGRRVFPALTVFDNLRVGSYARKDRDRLEPELDFVFQLFPKLKERRRQYAGTLSGGEQQMLAVGRALMSKPKLLLLDEPSLGLSPRFVETIMETIVFINDHGVSVLLVEQNALAALSIAQRGYVLETGRIVLAEESRALLASDDVRRTYLGEGD